MLLRQADKKAPVGYPTRVTANFGDIRLRPNRLQKQQEIWSPGLGRANAKVNDIPPCVCHISAVNYRPVNLGQPASSGVWEVRSVPGLPYTTTIEAKHSEVHMPKTALITGVTGQDGAYLAEFLLKKEYVVHGVKRRSSSFNTSRIEHLYQDPHQQDRRFFLHYGDLSDATSLIRLIQEIRPDEIYNLAAQSHVQVSFETPEYTANIDGVGTLRLLEAVRLLGMEKHVRFYQASTSELFGVALETPQTETTPFYPRSPYAAAKLYAHWITVNYREAYGMHASNGILFNHESPIRGETFVTRKITRAVAAISHGRQDRLYIGNLDAQRDWGHARDYVEGMWLMLQQPQPDDYVLATGEAHSVREFIECAFAEVGIDIVWRGSAAGEEGLDRRSGRVLVEVDPRYYRPTEVSYLLGDPRKAQKLLGWRHRTAFRDLVREMVASDMAAAAREHG